MSVLTLLLEEAGSTKENTAKNSNLGRVFASQPVQSSLEFERIKALPRRRWQDRADLDTLVDKYSARLRRNETARLFAMQAVAFAEFEEFGTVNTVAALGEGKTLVSACLPVLAQAKRPLFLNYSRLMEKTIREFRELAADWHICHNYTFFTIEKLSLAQYANYLDRIQPDLIVIDEAHSLANPEGARFRRLRRYKDANPSVPVLPLTATPGTDSPSQYAHIQALVLGEGSPLPREEWVLDEWCEALDTEVRGQRRPPGVLAEFADGSDELEQVRAGIGLRIEETPGNIYCRNANSVECSVYMTDIKLDLAPHMNELVSAAWRDMTLPDGRCFEELYDKSLILRQLGCGYAKVIDPAPPTEWREARSLWSAFVREILRNEEVYGLDTPAQVKAAVRAGEIEDGGLLKSWCEIEPTFVLRTKTEWFDLTLGKFATEWIHRERGLVWVTQPTVGRKLAEMSGLPFFHANGRDPVKGSIESYYERTGAILALRSNYLGRNLQDRWHKSLYVSPPSSALELEQSIGRIVRRGQKASTCEITFLLTVFENWAAIQAARESARTDRSLGGNRGLALLNSDWCCSDLAAVRSWKGPCWER